MEIPAKEKNQKRIVIVGAGFAGLTLAKRLSAKHFQIVLLDKNNYHQFQPLLYQVAMAGLEPSSISFPLRKIFQHKKHVCIRIAEVLRIAPQNKEVETSIGNISYDYLVLANGATTNFFGMKSVEQHAFSMKSVSEALLLRNTLLQNYEKAVNTADEKEKSALLNIIVVGGGPTGVELAGAIAELRDNILPKDYPELNFHLMKIYLMEAAPRLLNGMSAQSAEKVQKYLTHLGVTVKCNTSVKAYNGTDVVLNNNTAIKSNCLIWAAGVKGNAPAGLPHALTINNRLSVDEHNRLHGYNDIFVIGDLAAMVADKDSNRLYPQVAPVAMQQAALLAENLLAMQKNNKLKPFKYHDKGTMATVGRNLAVAEIGPLKLKGAIAWVVWMFVHLMSIIGVKNKIFVLINWVWQYFTYDQSLRLIIHPTEKEEHVPEQRNAVVIA